ncbi:hypothetical protein M569_15888 [Genlisea aurea]|uniref:Retrovirus-related Pol polyprotein from transposon TNT 1-94-like beta-barrel domain-containing protein n=1 Tax=Genlisea aurea TaxID=192259 RepID=S8D8C2_9LAMI|nr:hypothetical protein M569_15888 [Genlisea aurea]
MTPAERDLYKNEVCQYCNVQGHIAKICWWLRRTQPNSPDETIPQSLASLQLDNTLTQTEWTSDTGATNHMTGKFTLFNNLKPYTGSNGVIIGDGTTLPITGIGTTALQQNTTSIPLNDVLYIPQLTKNLLSVSQLTRQEPVNCEFTNTGLIVKDRTTGRRRLTGNRRGGLYVVNAPQDDVFSPQAAFFSSRFKSCSSEIWHHRLGHPQDKMDFDTSSTQFSHQQSALSPDVPPVFAVPSPETPSVTEQFNVDSENPVIPIDDFATPLETPKTFPKKKKCSPETFLSLLQIPAVRNHNLEILNGRKHTLKMLEGRNHNLKIWTGTNHTLEGRHNTLDRRKYALKISEGRKYNPKISKGRNNMTILEMHHSLHIR